MKKYKLLKSNHLTAQSTLFVVKLVGWLVGLDLLSMWSCSPTFWDMIGFESFFYCTWLLYVLSRIFGHRYIVPYLKCNTPPKKNFIGFLCVSCAILVNVWEKDVTTISPSIPDCTECRKGVTTEVVRKSWNSLVTVFFAGFTPTGTTLFYAAVQCESIS